MSKPKPVNLWRPGEPPARPATTSDPHSTAAQPESHEPAAIPGIKPHCYQLWTAAETDYLARLRQSGYSIRQCAKALGRSHDSIRNKAQAIERDRQISAAAQPPLTPHSLWRRLIDHVLSRFGYTRQP